MAGGYLGMVKDSVFIIVIICIFLICGCTKKESNSILSTKVPPNSNLANFDYIKDFEKNKSKFTSDTLMLTEFSTDGGMLSISRSKEKEYIVLDFWLYGETGNLNYTYWTDTVFSFIIVKQSIFDFDRPYYEGAFITDTTIRYLSYDLTSIKLFDRYKQEVKDSKFVNMTKAELESFFSELTEGIQINQ